MEATTYKRDTDMLRRSLFLAQCTNVGLVTAAVFLIILLIANIGRERTVIVPGGFSKSFWITDGSISSSGLEDLAAWMAYLKLDISPDNVLVKNEMTLKLTDPSQHGVMKSTQITEANRIKKENLATTFAVQGFSTNEEKRVVVVTGLLKTYVNGKDMGGVMQNYFMRFSMSGGKAQLINFKLVEHADIGRLILENPSK
jgi:conjugal transfer pilus assembly protein TraE